MSTALPGGTRGQILAVGLTIAVIGAVWAGVISPTVSWYQDRAERLSERETLARRMAYVAATLPALQREAEAAPASAPTAGALIGGESDAIAGARLQELVQGLAAHAGTNLTSFENLPPEASGAYRRIMLRVALNTSYPTLVKLLQEIDEANPPVIVDDVRMAGSRIPGRTGNSPLDVTFTVIAFRAATGEAQSSQKALSQGAVQ